MARIERLAQWNACETWFDPDGALRVYGADDLGGRELAALWIAPEHGYEEAAGLHVTVDGGPVPYSSTPEWSRRPTPRPSGSASRPSDTRRRSDDCQRPCILRLLLGRHCGTGAVAGGRAARIRLPRVRMRQLRDAGCRIQVDHIRPRALAGHRGRGVEARRTAHAEFYDDDAASIRLDGTTACMYVCFDGPASARVDGLHVSVQGRQVPLGEYAEMKPGEAARAVVDHIEELGRDA